MCCWKRLVIIQRRLYCHNSSLPMYLYLQTSSVHNSQLVLIFLYIIKMCMSYHVIREKILHHAMKLFLYLIKIVPKIKYSSTMQSHGLFLFHYALKNFNEYNDKSLTEQELEILFNNHFKNQ